VGRLPARASVRDYREDECGRAATDSWITSIGGKFVRGRGMGKETEVNEYELQRAANIKENLKRTRTLAASTNGPTLRSRTERDIVDEESENSYEESDNPINDEEQPIGHQNIRKGRGPTLKKNIYSSSGGPKICITLNEYGQPVGRNSKEFGNFIGTLVRKNIPVSCEDWRLVDSKKKFELWTKVKEYYEMDESGIDYVITSAAKKWREFKADLKNKYFDETLSFEELIAKRDERVKESDWEWLITYWMSPEAEVHSNRGKDNRSKLTMSHAAGSKSYARVGHELAEQQGRPARRDEIYVRTHTRKNKEGDIVPLPGAEIFINKFEEAVAENPELKDRSIEDGDLYAHVFGEKEPRGRIRGLGIGPTPQDVGTPGTQMKISTKLQMALQARSQSEQEVRALRQDMNQMKEKMDQIYQMMVAAQGVQHIESPSQHGSNSRQNSRVHRSDEVAHDYNGNNHSQNMVEDDFQLTRRVASTMGRLRNREDVNTIEEQSHRRDIATMVPQRNHGSSQNADDNPVGKEVILYSMMRSEVPVAIANIISTDPTTKVGDVPLGREFTQVFVTRVLKRESTLPRPYLGVESMGYALFMPIAWPTNKMGRNKKSTLTQGSTAAELIR